MEDSIFPSVTTVLSSKESPELDAWREAVGEKEANFVTGLATRKGTKVHEMAEHYLDNKEVDLNKYTIVEQQSFKSLRPVLDENIDNIMVQEATLFSKRMRMAGRVDVIGDWKRTPSIIDFKTSFKRKEEDMIHGYLIQKTAYSIMFKELTGIQIDQIVTVISVDHDKPQIFVRNPSHYLNDLIKIRRNFYRKWKT